MPLLPHGKTDISLRRDEAVTRTCSAGITTKPTRPFARTKSERIRPHAVTFAVLIFRRNTKLADHRLSTGANQQKKADQSVSLSSLFRCFAHEISQVSERTSIPQTTASKGGPLEVRAKSSADWWPRSRIFVR
jgi:hypothetical protein